MTDTFDAPVDAPPVTRYPIEFSGTGGEFFRIWIVNIALSVVTLGIYSAWATVRTRRYFYGKTTLDGTPFQFTAKPIPILIGRIIAFVLFGTYSYLSAFKPLWAVGFLVLVLLPLSPWIIVKSQQFRARYSAWRNIPFRFSGTYGDAFITYILLPIGAAFTLWIILPIFWKESARFQYNNLHFGHQDFHFDKERKGFWSTLGLAVVFVLGGASLLGGIAFGIVFAAKEVGVSDSFLEVLPILIVIGIYLPFILVAPFVQGRLFNAVLGGVSFGAGQLEPKLPVADWIWVQFSNFAMILLTLGIAYPWAKVRATRYKLRYLSVLASEALFFEAAGGGDDVGAAGAELSSGFDFDISLF